MKFYHVSKKNLHDKVLKPRIPLNRMNNEDDITPRICVSTSINGCLTATGSYLVGELVHVYYCESDHFKQPQVSDVLDAPLTGEMWILEPVKMKHFATIKITNVCRSYIGEMSNFVYTFERYVEDII